jgi:hypothetical protein
MVIVHGQNWNLIQIKFTNQFYYLLKLDKVVNREPYSYRILSLWNVVYLCQHDQDKYIYIYIYIYISFFLSFSSFLFSLAPFLRLNIFNGNGRL